MKNEVEKLENCAIRVKTDRETLEIRIPGRLTRGFWAFMGLALFFVFAGWLIYRFTDDFCFLVAGICICVWFFFWTRPRRETIIFLEQGKYNPSLKLAHNVAKALKTTMDEIFILED